MDAKKPAWSLRILEFLEETGQPYDDDCLARELGATRRQTINAACRRLVSHGKLVRQRVLCPRCGRTKLHNFLPQLMQERKAALQDMVFIYQHTLNDLEMQAARHGMDVPAALVNQIGFHKKKLTEVRQELKKLEQI